MSKKKAPTKRGFSQLQKDDDTSSNLEIKQPQKRINIAADKVGTSVSSSNSNESKKINKNSPGDDPVSLTSQNKSTPSRSSARINANKLNKGDASVICPKTGPPPEDDKYCSSKPLNSLPVSADEDERNCTWIQHPQYYPIYAPLLENPDLDLETIDFDPQHQIEVHLNDYFPQTNIASVSKKIGSTNKKSSMSCNKFRAALNASNIILTRNNCRDLDNNELITNQIYDYLEAQTSDLVDIKSKYYANCMLYYIH